MKVQVTSECTSEPCPVVPATAVAATSAGDQDMSDLQQGLKTMSVEDAGQSKDPVQSCTEDLKTLPESPSKPILTNKWMGISPQLHKALRDKQTWIGAYCCGDCALRHNDCLGWNNLPGERPHGPRCTGFVVENGNEEDDTAATFDGWNEWPRHTKAGWKNTKFEPVDVRVIDAFLNGICHGESMAMLQARKS